MVRLVKKRHLVFLAHQKFVILHFMILKMAVGDNFKLGVYPRQRAPLLGGT